MLISGFLFNSPCRAQPLMIGASYQHGTCPPVLYKSLPIGTMETIGLTGIKPTITHGLLFFYMTITMGRLENFSGLTCNITMGTKLYTVWS